MGWCIKKENAAKTVSALIKQLLWEPPEIVSRWRTQLLEALAGNGAVLLDVVPELSLLTGPLPAVAELGPAEAQSRFKLVFRDFMRAFCRPGASTSLILFLDDAQWADAASLALLESLMTDPQIGHLLLLIAYRDMRTIARLMDAIFAEIDA